MGDCHNSLISDSIRRDTLEAVMQNLQEVEEVATVVMVPGKGWDPSADTDEDSDPEEDPTGKGIKLPRNLLFGEASLTTRGAGWGFWAGKYMRMVLRAGKFMRMVLRAGKYMRMVLRAGK